MALFVRTRHGVELTTAGRMYLKSVTSHLLGLERSTVDLMNHKGLGGVLKLGVVPTFATRWLLPKLQDFNERHPKINLHLETSTKPFCLVRTCSMRQFCRHAAADSPMARGAGASSDG